MRRMMYVALGLGLLAASVGCSCVHGVCDCDRPAPAVLQAEPVAASAAPMPYGAPVETAPMPVHGK